MEERFAAIVAWRAGRDGRRLDLQQVWQAGPCDDGQVGRGYDKPPHCPFPAERKRRCVNTHPKSQARVISAYQAPYDDPIAVRAGEEVLIDSARTTDCAGWVWCASRAGKGGWVPEAYIERHGEVGSMRCDYDAIELTVRVGDILTVHKAESGFLWVTDLAGRTGWVPSAHVEPYTAAGGQR